MSPTYGQKGGEGPTRATYQDIAKFLASTINATRFDNGNNAVTADVFVRSAAVTDDGLVTRVDLSDGSFFFLDPEYLVPRTGV